MLRNDYRRSLILLRSNSSGFAGHVRLERRTLMGGMYFSVQAPEDAENLQAALIGRSKKGYYACDLGSLRRDGQRQFGLSASFDPRNICGRALEEYQLAAVLQTDAEGCEIVLFGNLNGHAEMDWRSAVDAACSLYAQADAPIPQPQSDLPSEPTDMILPPEENAAEEPVQSADADGEAQTNVSESTQERQISEEPAERLARDLLEIDMDQPWPESIEALRPLFQSERALEIVPDGEHVYIAAPMPEMSGYDSCAVGLRVEDGKIVAVSYALPSLYSSEPPAGLEEYTWSGDNSRGWWVREVKVED